MITQSPGSYFRAFATTESNDGPRVPISAERIVVVLGEDDEGQSLELSIYLGQSQADPGKLRIAALCESRDDDPFTLMREHLHQFHINGEQYGPPAARVDFEDEVLDERAVPVSKLIPKSGRKSRWIYEYDFGDGWRHEVLFEGFLATDPKAKYPLCLEGERACPPEDCGGPWGFANYLSAIADPRHKEHRAMLKWRGPFDPEAFHARVATNEMRKVK